MANLSNINNKFLFTDGDFLKIGNLAPINNISGTESGISITNGNCASITLDNSAAQGKTFSIYSAVNGSLNFYDVDANSSRLVIDTSGNATFEGKITAPTLSIQNQINTTSSNLEINYANGDGTTTNFKDFYVRDGKNGVILNIQGSSKNSTFSGEVSLKSRLNLQRSSGGATTLIQFKNEIGVDRAHIDFGGTNEELSFFAGSGSSENMRIDGSGNVGIGTSPGSNMLYVKGTTNGADITTRFAPFSNNSSSTFFLSSVSSGDGGYFYNSNNNTGGLFSYGDYTFYVGTGNLSGSGPANPRMTILQGGNVGIGTTLPATQLDIGIGTLGNNGYGGIRIQDDAAHFWMLIVKNSVGDRRLSLYHGQGSIPLVLQEGGGNVGIGTVSPGSKLEIFGGGNTLRMDSAGNTAKTFLMRNVNTAIAEIKTDGNLDINIEDTGRTMRFLNGNTERMRIGNAGKVTVFDNISIGGLAGTAKLQVNSTVNAGGVSVAAFLVNSSITVGTEVRLAFAANTNDDIATGRYSYISTVNTSGSNGQAMTFATNISGASAVERMRITSSGKVVVQGENFVIDDVREHREEFYISGNSAYNFDVDIKNIGASGQPFEVFVAFTHYSTSYGAAYHAAYYQRSTVQSDITLIHQYFNQNSTRGGTWTVTWLSATQIRISKSAGVGGGGGHGYLRVTQVDF